MKLREAVPEDAQRIAALHAASWRSAYRGMLSDEYLDDDLVGERTAVWVERLTTPKPTQRVVLAEIEDQLAGFVCAFASDDLVLGTLLDNLHVSREFQRHGIGAKLMREIASWCESRGEGLFLWVLEQNAQARQFYEHLGGVKVREEIWDSPDGGALPSLCYAWKDLAVLMQTLNARVSKNKAGDT